MVLPFITKHNQGGKGLGVRRFDRLEDFDAYVDGSDFECPVDGITLLQEYVHPAEGYITRVEIVGGEFLYALTADTSAGFELCPADECEVTGESFELCPADALPAASLFHWREGFRDPIIDRYLEFCRYWDIGIAGFEFIETEIGPVDILVNNAGVIVAAGYEEREVASEADWDITFLVNLKGLGTVIDTVSPHMKERRYGKIVNIASIAARKGTLTSTPYGASKAGVVNVTQATALELAPFNINVNAICPGLLWTDMWERIAVRYRSKDSMPDELTPREVFDRFVKARTPLGREQTPEDIGNATVFLASDAAENITGQALNICGGFMMN